MSYIKPIMQPKCITSKLEEIKKVSKVFYDPAYPDNTKHSIFCTICNENTQTLARTGTKWLSPGNSYACEKCKYIARYRTAFQLIIDCINTNGSTNIFMPSEENIGKVIKKYIEHKNLNVKVTVTTDEDICKTTKFENNSFDVIACFEVLEHLYDYKSAIVEFERLLKPGGTILMSFPIEAGPIMSEHLKLAELCGNEIQWHGAPMYHGENKKHPVFWIFYPSIVTEIGTLFSTCVLEHYADPNFGNFGSGYNIIRIKKA